MALRHLRFDVPNFAVAGREASSSHQRIDGADGPSFQTNLGSEGTGALKKLRAVYAAAIAQASDFGLTCTEGVRS